MWVQADGFSHDVAPKKINSGSNGDEERCQVFALLKL